MTDMDDQEKSECQNSLLYREFVENSPHMICAFTPDMKIEYTNSKFRHILSTLNYKLPAESILTLVPEDKLEVFKSFIASLTPEKNEMSFEYPYPAGGEEKIWKEWIVRASFNRENRPERYFCIGKDISARKQMETALATRELNYKLLFEQSPVGIYIAETNGTILEANDALIKMLGSPSKEATKEINVRTLPQLVECGYSDAFREVVEKGETRTIELEYNSKWKKATTVFSYIIPLTDPDGKVISVYTLMLDVTERRKAEQTLKQTLDEKQVLFTELQHRVKNSFMLITGMVELMQSRECPEETLSVLEEVQTRITAVSQMYELLYATGSISEVDFGEYLSRLGESLLGITSGIELKANLESVILPVKKAITCGIIVAELLTNSLKHAFPNRQRGTVELLLKKSGTDAVVEIIDNGRGISREENPGAESPRGMMLIRGLTKQIRGQLKITGDNGTRCTLTIPGE